MMFKSFIGAAAVCAVKAAQKQTHPDGFHNLFEERFFTFQGKKKLTLRTLDSSSDNVTGFHVQDGNPVSVQSTDPKSKANDAMELPSTLFQKKIHIFKGDKLLFGPAKIEYFVPRQSSPMRRRGERERIEYSDPVVFNCVEIWRQAQNKNDHCFISVGLVPETTLRHNHDFYTKIVYNLVEEPEPEVTFIDFKPVLPSHEPEDTPVDFKPVLPSRGNAGLPPNPAQPQYESTFRRWWRNIKKDPTADLRKYEWQKPTMSQLTRALKHHVAAKSGDTYYRCTVENKIGGRRGDRVFETRAYKNGCRTFGKACEHIDIKWTEPENMPPTALETTRVPLKDFLVYEFLSEGERIRRLREHRSSPLRLDHMDDNVMSLPKNGQTAGIEMASVI